MMNRMRGVAGGILLWLIQVFALSDIGVRAEQPLDNDLRNIGLGMSADDLPRTGYANFSCGAEPGRTFPDWQGWSDCPVSSAGMREIRFGYDPETNPEGTRVAGHPVILTLAIDSAGHVAGLRIETDPKARLYARKKAFLLGVQTKSRYGAEGWVCTESQPSAGEQAVGGVYVNERCSKTISGRNLMVERRLFRGPDQDVKSFVDETRISILLAKG